MIAPVIVGADDYGLSPGVSAAIRELIQKHRLTATSCMTISPLWPAEGEQLKPLADDADLGLHLTLTTLKPLGEMPHTAAEGRLPSFKVLFRRSLRGELNAEEIHAEWSRQIDAFETVMGRPPDYLDGHHHVHQLRTIRDVLLRLFQERLQGRPAYIRSCVESAATIVRRRVDVARALSFSVVGRPLRREAARLGVPINAGFSGVYDFSDRVPYDRLFERFLVNARPGTFIMCHPGLVDDELRAIDDLTDQREREYAYLSSPEYTNALARAGVRLGRFHAS